MQGEGDMAKLEIHIETDKAAGTITISDTVTPPPLSSDRLQWV